MRNRDYVRKTVGYTINGGYIYRVNKNQRKTVDVLVVVIFCIIASLSFIGG